MQAINGGIATATKVNGWRTMNGFAKPKVFVFHIENCTEPIAAAKLLSLDEHKRPLIDGREMLDNLSNPIHKHIYTYVFDTILHNFNGTYTYFDSMGAFERGQSSSSVGR